MIVPSLLNRSNYSFLQSALTVKEIVDFSVRNNFSHAVISDFGSAHSWPKFYKEAEKNNLIPVFGLQINHKNSDLLFLAKDKLGFKELLKLATHKNVDEISFDNLILIHLGGQDYFPDQFKYFANEEGENGVYVRENKFLSEQDFEFYCVLRAIDGNNSVDSQRELNDHVRGDYLEAEVTNLSGDSPQIKNIYSILEQCTKYDILEKRNTLCFFENPEQQLRNLVDSLFASMQFKNDDEKRLYKFRLDEELKVIVDKGFCEYFLIVQDAVKWAKSNDVYVGPGRGSVCGSLLAYVLGITEIDPMVYDLYFERFLNTTRSTTPDIDIDVANNKRDDLFRYLKSKYGEDHVALISVYRTFKVKNSLRDVGKAYGIPNAILESYLKNTKSLDDELNFSEKGLALLAKEYPHVVPILKRIQNYPCNLSIHAAGVVISSESLLNIMPLITVAYSPLLSSQWEADELKDMGFVKFDFLALQYLQSLSNIEKRISDQRGAPIVWGRIDLNDPRVYETIIKGHNLFIFQFENIKIRRLIQSFKPSTLLDLALISSIHRPGASDQITVLLARKTSNSNTMSRTPQHEGFKEVSGSTVGPLMSILNDTYGLLIYQEQLMKIVSTATSCSFGESDTFRRGISSSPEKIPKAKAWFFKKAMNRFSQKELELLWELIFKFAKYGFNKSHAVAYALISYRLIWLKTYYPEIFYSEFLSANLNVDCFYELEELGFIIAPPTYGKSDYRLFKAIDKKFYFPVSSIIGLNLTQEQFSSIPFRANTAIDAVSELINSKIPPNAIKTLIKVGFFNELFSANESELFLETNMENIIDNSILKPDGTRMYQLDLKEVEVSQEDRKRYRAYQKELLGVDINKLRIPLKLFEKYKTLSRISSLSSQTTSSARYIGFITEGKMAETFREDSFLLLKVSDGFYTTPKMALFGKSKEEMEKWLRLAQEQTPVILDIEKNEEYYRITSIRQISKK